MNQFILERNMNARLISLCLLLGFFSCKKEKEPVNHAKPTSFEVTVVNGFGSGKYSKGDTVHIFSDKFSSNQIFDSWTGSDVSLLKSSSEWHTWFIMPDKNVTFTSVVKSATLYTLKFEQIKGRDIVKPVYYFFPDNHKGIVYLLHGTGGSASNLVSDYEWQTLITDLIYKQFAVIITESEEATTHTDLNSDGDLRWNPAPFDSVTNVDYANIKAITDTFINRGYTQNNKAKYSIGMSNGGAFSCALSTLYRFSAAVSYCAQSGNLIASAGKTPILFCMARFDSHPNVGAAGNAEAEANSQTLKSRGICSNILFNEHSPLYPERFARRGDISNEISQKVFNEIKENGYLDNKNFFKGSSDAYKEALLTTPTLFPETTKLSISQIAFILEQINISIAEHHFFSDFNTATISFLESPCN
ncbi:MAG: hypothetical protein J5I91_04535 [Bacteroidetes bacterium]|nr:hypothetical protein [Bacteroidota bacterium]